MYLGQRVEKTEAGGLGTGGTEPALLNSLPVGATALSAQVQGPPASTDLTTSLYHDSGSGIWVWMLMKRQDHFNPHAANYVTNSCQSLNPYECPVKCKYSQMLPPLILMTVLRGTLMIVIPR